MRLTQEQTEQRLMEELKSSYGEARRRDDRSVERWCQRYKKKIKKLGRISQKTDEELANTIGCFPSVFASCRKLAGDEALVNELRISYQTARTNGIAAVKRWARENRSKVSRLKEISGKTAKELAKLVGCSEIVFRYEQRKKSAENREPGERGSKQAPVIQSEAALIAELKESHAKARARGRVAIRKWCRVNRKKVEHLRTISKRTITELSRLIGCSRTGVFYPYKKVVEKAKVEKPSKTAKPATIPQKFGPDFWNSLFATRKEGEVMKAALESLFDEIGDQKEEIARLTEENKNCGKEKIARLIGERDAYKEELKKTKIRLQECLKAAEDFKGIRTERDRLLRSAMSRAMSHGGESSLNENP